MTDCFTERLLESVQEASKTEETPLITPLNETVSVEQVERLTPYDWASEEGEELI